MHFRISSSLSFQRKTKRHVFLLLFVLTPVHLNWPSYATGKCYRSPRKLISSMKHWWLYLTIHSLTIFKLKMCNLRLNLIYLSFFVQYISSSSDLWLLLVTLVFKTRLSTHNMNNKNNYTKLLFVGINSDKLRQAQLCLMYLLFCEFIFKNPISVRLAHGMRNTLYLWKALHQHF